MFNKAKAYRDSHITPANNWEEFISILDTKTGFVSAHWDGTGETCDNVIDPHFTQNVFNQKHQFCFCLRFLLSIYRFFVFFVFIGLKSDFSFNVLYKHEIEFIKNGYNTSL